MKYSKEDLVSITDNLIKELNNNYHFDINIMEKYVPREMVRKIRNDINYTKKDVKKIIIGLAKVMIESEKK